jgi:hypothetical protein
MMKPMAGARGAFCGKAGWVMGPTNEVLRQFVGKLALFGFEALDYWNQTVNERVLHNEVKKLDLDGKRRLAAQLLAEVDQAEIDQLKVMPATPVSV